MELLPVIRVRSVAVFRVQSDREVALFVLHQHRVAPRVSADPEHDIPGSFVRATVRGREAPPTVSSLKDNFVTVKA